MVTPPKDAVLAQLRMWALSEGGDLCDRCGEVIWPEIELVRCDSCWGKFGNPDPQTIKDAARRHAKRIAEYDRERLEEVMGDHQLD